MTKKKLKKEKVECQKVSTLSFDAKCLAFMLRAFGLYVDASGKTRSISNMGLIVDTNGKPFEASKILGFKQDAQGGNLINILVADK